MPIRDFRGKTFVSFMDISGFKDMMKRGDLAWRNLGHFFDTGYRALLSTRDNTYSIEGLFVSDCGILFVNTRDVPEEDKNIDNPEALKELLKVVKDINKRSIDQGYMLKTSISWGEFRYENKIVFEGIEKNAIYGGAYRTAYEDNEVNKPTIKPGICRLPIELMPTNIRAYLDNHDLVNDDIFKYIKKVKKHYNYYWMCSNNYPIETFEKRYDSANNLIYKGYLVALKNVSTIQV